MREKNTEDSFNQVLKLVRSAFLSNTQVLNQIYSLGLTSSILQQTIMPPAATENPAASDMAKYETPQTYLSTMPENKFSWQITLAQKVVAITGANRGIGLGIAEVCLANSAKMIYSLDLMEPGEEFVALQKRFSNLRYVQTDVTSEGSIEKAINQIVEETGRIDGLVANAGMTKHQPALKFDRSELEQLFNLNVNQST